MMLRTLRSSGSIGSSRHMLAAIALLLALTTAPAYAAKTDVVVLLNGDRITGEVKELSYGQLKFKTDDIGTIYIEWTKIASLSTTQVLQVELADGRRLFGRAPENGTTTGSLRIRSRIEGTEERVPVELPMVDIVRLAVTEEGEPWRKRVDGDFSLGYSFTQASNVEVFNVSGQIGARDRIRRWNVALDAQVTSQEIGPASQRSSLNSALERYMSNRYYRETQLEFSRNQELGLDLRSLLGGTVGRYLVQTQSSEWRAGLGLAGSIENGTDGSKRESVEAQLTTSLRLFRFDSPKTNVTASFSLLPSLTESGRWRGEASIQARRELITDLFFEISLNDSYDNEPTEGAETNDWNIGTSIGYTF